jgi:hypothetical protein
MKTIIIKTQAELDALPDRFDEWTVIEIRAETRICVTKAWGNSSVEAWGNSSVEARENSSVVAWGNSSVVARENSSVVAWENSSVEARENSSVVAWENSSVVAWGNSAIHVQSAATVIELFGFAVAWLLAKAKVKKHGHATVITPTRPKGISGWLNSQAVKAVDGFVVLFKRVSKDFKTQEGTDHETNWAIGQTLEHPAWNPKGQECGAGKFHACSRPYFCNEFRFKLSDDRYIAVKIAVKDIYAWPNGQYLYKVAFRKGTVLHEVDKYGRKI